MQNSYNETINHSPVYFNLTVAKVSYLPKLLIEFFQQFLRSQLLSILLSQSLSFVRPPFSPKICTRYKMKCFTYLAQTLHQWPLTLAVYSNNLKISWGTIPMRVSYPKPIKSDSLRLGPKNQYLKHLRWIQYKPGPRLTELGQFNIILSFFGGVYIVKQALRLLKWEKKI